MDRNIMDRKLDLPVVSETFNESRNLLFPKTPLMHSMKHLNVNSPILKTFRVILPLIDLF